MSWERWRSLPNQAKSNWLVTFFYLQKLAALKRGVSIEEEVMTWK